MYHESEDEDLEYDDEINADETNHEPTAEEQEDFEEGGTNAESAGKADDPCDESIDDDTPRDGDPTMQDHDTSDVAGGC